MVGSICNGRSQLEIKFTFSYRVENFKKGSAVSVTGLIEKNPPGPAILKVRNEGDLQVFENQDRMAFIDVLNSFKTH